MHIHHIRRLVYLLFSTMLLYPPLQRSWKGGILVSPCPSVRPSVCPSVAKIVSALYLQQCSSDPIHICTSYQATKEGVSRVMPVSKFKKLKFWRIFLICKFDFVFFWLGIQYDSMVWVIMRRWGYPQNAGVLVVLVFLATWCNWFAFYWCWIKFCLSLSGYRCSWYIYRYCLYIWCDFEEPLFHNLWKPCA